MKKTNLILKTILLLFAFVFTITISKIVPNDKFEAYKLELDSLWEKIDSEQEYLIDITGNYTTEIIRHHNINLPGHSIVFQQENKIQQVHIFEYGDEFIGKYLKFADIDSNNTQELIFVSAKNFNAYLNIYSYNAETKELLSKERIKIDTIGRFNDKMDAINNFIATTGNNIYLDLQGSYSVQPRNIYKYNLDDKTFTKNRLNSLVTPEVKHFKYQKENYLLASYVRATGNTLSPTEAEMLRTSTDEDTLAIYEELKHLEYEYGDFSSYILLYDDNLNFAFEPIEFFGWTNFTKGVIVLIDNIPHIVAFTNAQMNEPENEKCKLVTVCNLKGEIIKQIPLLYNFTDIYTVKNRIIFYGEKTLFITDENLNPINEIENISFVQGFVDINNDKKNDFVAFSNNVLKIYSENLKLNATYKIEQEFAPYPEKFNFTTLQTDNKNSIVFNTRLFYYKFNYEQNKLAFFQYPFYATVFLLVFGFLFLNFRLNSKRLEKENIKLEQIVKERTKEIAIQKEEIQSQADELKAKNENLVELSEFKKLMTGTIIHDLKNPLSFIIGATKDKPIRQAGYNMLHIVLNILDINKAQATKLNLKIEKQNVEYLIKKAVEQVVYLAEQKNLAIEKIINKEFQINADKDLTIRILVNLLTNAIKFSHLNNKITINVTEKNKFAQIEVIDYGVGISQESIKDIFKEYTQIDAKKSGKIKSTGLGLTFCKIATEAQNAKIEVSSIPNEKTVFSLVFPIVSISAKKAEEKTVAENKNLLSEGERKNIKEVLLELKEIETYRATEIINLLNKIENSSENIKLWKQKITTAMFAMNDELYLKMIENEL